MAARLAFLLLLVLILVLNAVNVDSALGIHSNLGEALASTLRSHIFVAHEYSESLAAVSPTCSSLEGLHCWALRHTDGDDDDHDDGQKVSKVANRRSILEEGIGYGAETEEFSALLSDTLMWLVSEHDVLDELWEHELDDEKTRHAVDTAFKQHEHSSEANETVETAQRLLSLSLIPPQEEFRSSRYRMYDASQTPTGQSRLETSRNQPLTWWNPLHWVRLIDRFSTRLAEIILGDMVEDTRHDTHSTTGGTPSSSASKAQDDTALAHLRQLLKESTPTDAEFHNDGGRKPADTTTSSAVAEDVLLSKDLWASLTRRITFERPMFGSRLPEYFGSSNWESPVERMAIRWIGDFVYHENMSCVLLNSRKVSILFEKPAVVSELWLRLSNQRNQELYDTAATWNESYVFAEGWYWDKTSRKSFATDDWFFSNASAEALRKHRISSAWSFELSLDAKTKNVSLVNGINLVKDSPYRRVDGISLTFAVGKTTVGDGARTDVADDIFQTLNSTKTQTKTRHVMPETRLPSAGFEVCLQQLTLHHAAITADIKNEFPEIGDAVTLSSAYIPGVIIREPSLETIASPWWLRAERMAESTTRPMYELHKDILAFDRDYLRKAGSDAAQSNTQKTSHHLGTPSFAQRPSFLPGPETASDGVVLNPDFRDPMGRYTIILQSRIPVEAPLYSLEDLRLLNRLVARKPTQRSQGSYHLAHSRRPTVHSSNTGSSASKAATFEPDLADIVMLKRKLMEVVQESLENAKQSQRRKVLSGRSDQSVTVHRASSSAHSADMDADTWYKTLADTMSEVLKEERWKEPSSPVIDKVDVVLVDENNIGHTVRVDLADDVALANPDDTTSTTTFIPTNERTTSTPQSIEDVFQHLSLEQKELVSQLLEEDPESAILDETTGTLHIATQSRDGSTRSTYAFQGATTSSEGEVSPDDDDPVRQAQREALARHYEAVERYHGIRRDEL